MTNAEILDIIRYSVPLFKETRPGVYQTRCGFCGDTQKTMRDGHMYIFNTEENAPMGFYCHKCNAKGKITPTNISKFTPEYKKIVFDANTMSSKFYHAGGGNCRGYTNGNNNINTSSNGYKYLVERIGCDIPMDTLSKMKIVWDWDHFCNENELDDNIRNMFDNRIVFLNTDNTSIIGRRLSGRYETPWIKRSKSNTYAPYIISCQYDIMGYDDVVVRMSEGIFDILSVCMKYSCSESDIHVASLGKDYGRVVEYCIQHGIIGTNISIEVYSDKDVPLQELKRQLVRYKPLYKKISVLYPTTKDFGIPIQKIQISNSYIL